MLGPLSSTTTAAIGLNNNNGKKGRDAPSAFSLFYYVIFFFYTNLLELQQLRLTAITNTNDGRERLGINGGLETRCLGQGLQLVHLSLATTLKGCKINPTL